jgi:hypothetical protein
VPLRAMKLNAPFSGISGSLRLCVSSGNKYEQEELLVKLDNQKRRSGANYTRSELHS